MTMNATLHSGIWHSNMKLKFLPVNTTYSGTNWPKNRCSYKAKVLKIKGKRSLSIFEGYKCSWGCLSTETVNILPNKLWRTWLAKSMVNLILERCPSTKCLHNSFCLFHGIRPTLKSCLFLIHWPDEIKNSQKLPLCLKR